MKVRPFAAAALSTSLLCAGFASGAPATASEASGASEASKWPTTFRLDAETLDGGQQIVSVTLDLPSGTRVDADSLARDTFAVRAKGVNPYRGAETGSFVGAYDAARTVTGVLLNRAGDVAPATSRR